MIYAWAFGMLAGAMIAFPMEAAEAAAQGLGLWAKSVAPVLGPFLVCMLMVTSRVQGGQTLRVLCGWLCGSPGGARLMREARLIGPSALRAAAMTGTMSPMFFLGTVSGWLQNPGLGRLILACHICGALLLGLCVRGRGKPSASPPSPLPLAAALRESALALLTVALCMMLGCVASRMAACAFPRLPAWAAAALQCGLEVTAGVKALIALASPHTPVFVCAASSFGGLSILLQNAAFWQDSGVTPGQLFLLRILHGILSGGLCYIILRLFS